MSNAQSVLLEGIAREAFVEGYKEGYHVEEYSDKDIQVANSLFEQWWAANYE